MMGGFESLRRLMEKIGGVRPRFWSRSPVGDTFYPAEMNKPRESIAPFVPSPRDVVKKMLELADLKPGEVLYDLGSGDGRIVNMSAKEFGSKAVGVDLNGSLIVESINMAAKLGVSDSVQFIRGNVFDVDLSPADVVTMYLLTSSNEKLRLKLESELKRGSRVVTHDFPMVRWKFRRRLDFEGESGRHKLYLYVWDGERTLDLKDGVK
jgi:Methyltransferase domain